MKLLPIAGNCPFSTFVAFESLSRCFLPMLTLALAGGRVGGRLYPPPLCKLSGHPGNTDTTKNTVFSG